MTTLADKIAPFAAQFRRDGFVMVPTRSPPTNSPATAPPSIEPLRVASASTRAARRENALRAVVPAMHQSVGGRAGGSPADLPSDRVRAAARLLGVAGSACGTTRRSTRRPAGAATDAHQDQPYWPMSETDTITGVDSVRRLDSTPPAAWATCPARTRSAAQIRQHLQARRRARSLEMRRSRHAAGIRRGATRRSRVPSWPDRPRGHGQPRRATRRVHTMIFFRDGSTRKNTFRMTPRAPPHRARRAHRQPRHTHRMAATAGDLPQPPPPQSPTLATAVKLGAFPDKPGSADG